MVSFKSFTNTVKKTATNIAKESIKMVDKTAPNIVDKAGEIAKESIKIIDKTAPNIVKESVKIFDNAGEIAKDSPKIIDVDDKTAPNIAKSVKIVDNAGEIEKTISHVTKEVTKCPKKLTNSCFNKFKFLLIMPLLCCICSMVIPMFGICSTSLLNVCTCILVLLYITIVGI